MAPLSPTATTLLVEAAIPSSQSEVPRLAGFRLQGLGPETIVPEEPEIKALVPMKVIARRDWVVPLSRGNQLSRSGEVYTLPRSPACQTISPCRAISMILFPCGLGLAKRQEGGVPRTGATQTTSSRKSKLGLAIHRQRWTNIFSPDSQL